MKIDEYENFEHIVDMVVKKISPACILKSEGGLGKSYLVRKKLKQQLKPDEYEIRSGHITPLALYKLMYKNRNKIIVLDDVEEVLKSDLVVGILKAGLWDVEGDGKREITWSSTSEKLGDTPQKFTFNGGIILLCNKIPRKYDSVISALRTRNSECKIELTYKQKLDIFKRLIDSDDFFDIAGFKLKTEDREKLKNDLEKHTSVVLENFNFRTVVKLIKFYNYNKKYHPNKPDLYLDLHRLTSKIDEDKELIYQLTKSDLPVSAQAHKFIEQTGKSIATYYRIKNQLDIPHAGKNKKQHKTQQKTQHATKKIKSQNEKKIDENKNVYKNFSDIIVIKGDLRNGLSEYLQKREPKIKIDKGTDRHNIYINDILIATVSKRKDGRLKTEYNKKDSIRYKLVNGEKDFLKIYLEIKDAVDIITRRNSADKFWNTEG